MYLSIALLRLKCLCVRVSCFAPCWIQMCDTTRSLTIIMYTVFPCLHYAHAHQGSSFHSRKELIFTWVWIAAILCTGYQYCTKAGKQMASQTWSSNGSRRCSRCKKKCQMSFPQHSKYHVHTYTSPSHRYVYVYMLELSISGEVRRMEPN